MYYIMSDIHGCYNEFKEALSHWDKNTETLVVLGDLVDRGPDSLAVIRTLMNLYNDYPERVIVLKGNHDESFTTLARDIPESDLEFYYMNMHDETIKSFYEGDDENFYRHSNTRRCLFVRNNFKAELDFLATRPLYVETEHVIFVHAGINLKALDWKTDTRCMNHIRSPFIYASRTAPKRVFFGHTTTENLNKDKSNRIWFSDGADKVGIDGGVTFGGQLNAVKTTERGMVQSVVAIKSERALVKA